MRMWQLARTELATGVRSTLAAAGAAFGVLLIVNIASVSSWDQWQFHLVFYPLLLLIGGHINTSLAFKELHDKQRSYMYLTLPASQAEKYVTKLLITTVGYTLATLVVYFLFSLAAAGIGQLVFGMAHPIFDPFHPMIWEAIGLFIATHAVTFFGAIYFRKMHLINTLLWASIIGIALGILGMLLTRVVFGDLFGGAFRFGVDAGNLNLAGVPDVQRITDFFVALRNIVQITFYYVMPPFFWLLGFVKLRETEVRHGV
jgi:hypothetical protein